MAQNGSFAEVEFSDVARQCYAANLASPEAKLENLVAKLASPKVNPATPEAKPATPEAKPERPPYATVNT